MVRTSGEIHHKLSIGLIISRIKKIGSLLNLTLQISTHQFQKIVSAEAISYARTIITIEDKVIDVIKLARKLLVFRKEGTWVKRGENPPFYLTMGSFDGAEICEIIRIYLLEKLSPLLGKETLIYTETMALP